jgi:hypothetical protein
VNITEPSAFFSKVDELIEQQLAELEPYKREIKKYLALYFNMD